MTLLRLSEKADTYLRKLTLEIRDRCVGREGNLIATTFFAGTMVSLGLETETPEFDCINWTHSGADLTSDGMVFEVYVSPYTLGCSVCTPLSVISTVDELGAARISDQIILLKGEITREQLMPKNFPFYNPDEHKRIVQLLEAKRPQAIIAATSKNPEVAGGVYPFPYIEDGDFDIPSVYMTDREGDRLAEYAGQEVSLEIRSQRSPARGCNVIARKGTDFHRRVVVCAHIDAKDGTPGAIDNATGVVVLLLLAELLGDYSGNLGIEIVAINGEDYYSSPGEKLFLSHHTETLSEIALGINLDGLGYQEGRTAYSLYGCPPEMTTLIHKVLSARSDIVEGDPWYQSDHSLFILNQRPALALTSDRFDELWSNIAHTPRDRPEIVDRAKLVSAAYALRDLLIRLDEILT